MSFRDLRRAIKGEIFDYQTLLSHLKEYKKPRDKITQLLKDGTILRVKKGLYIFGPDFRKTLFSQEILANLIYGPSYISLEYALSKYGLIPERVYTVTSICLDRTKRFKTPVGLFSYKTRPLKVYPIGIEFFETAPIGGYLMATPEKALVDLLSQTKGIKDVQEMREHLYENMRMEASDLKKLNKKLLVEILDCYGIPHTLIRAIYDQSSHY